MLAGKAWYVLHKGLGEHREDNNLLLGSLDDGWY